MVGLIQCMCIRRRCLHLPKITHQLVGDVLFLHRTLGRETHMIQDDPRLSWKCSIVPVCHHCSKPIWVPGFEWGFFWCQPFDFRTWFPPVTNSIPQHTVHTAWVRAVDIGEEDEARTPIADQGSWLVHRSIFFPRYTCITIARIWRWRSTHQRSLGEAEVD